MRNYWKISSIINIVLYNVHICLLEEVLFCFLSLNSVYWIVLCDHTSANYYSSSYVVPFYYKWRVSGLQLDVLLPEIRFSGKRKHSPLPSRSLFAVLYNFRFRTLTLDSNSILHHVWTGVVDFVHPQSTQCELSQVCISNGEWTWLRFGGR